MRFIGHLDLLALFQRCMKRTGLPISYSKGFHPHQIMSFALPLSLGMGSVGEYVDVEFDTEEDVNEVLRRFNKIAPEDLRTLEVRKLKQGEKNGASIVEAGIYKITLPKDSLITQAEIKEMLSQEEILILKKTKKKEEVEINVRPYIFEASFDLGGDIHLLIASGSKENLKPDVVINYLYEKVGQTYNPYRVYYLRENLLKKQNNTFISVMEVSE